MLNTRRERRSKGPVIPVSMLREQPLLPRRRVRHAPKQTRFVVALFALERVVGHKICLTAEAGDHCALLVPVTNAFGIVGKLATVVARIWPPHPVVVFN